MLVLNKRAHALLAQARVRAKQAHVHFDRAREQKAERESDDPYNRMRREGGAFALVTPHESRPLSLSAAKSILRYDSSSSLFHSLAFCFFSARFPKTGTVDTIIVLIHTQF